MSRVDSPEAGPDPDATHALSSILRSLMDSPGETLTVGEVMDRFDSRAFGATLFTFSAPNLLPMPPGASTVLGAPLLLIAPQVAVGRQTPWIPESVRRRVISRKALTAAFSRLMGPLQRIERVSRPRMPWLFGRKGEHAAGIVCSLLALVLILPIPFGNMLPAAAIAALSLSLVLRDGVIALAGYALAAASVLVLVLTGHVVVATVRRLLEAVAI